MSLSNKSEFNVYVINSGFQLVASVLLAQERQHNIFLCLEESLCQKVKLQNKKWPAYFIKFQKLNGLFGRQRGIQRYLKSIFDILTNHSIKKINFFMPIISGSQYNYIIHSAKTKYGKKNITINIIPDGAANLEKFPLTSKNRKKIIKKEKSIFERTFNIKYTPYYDDKYGIVSDAVDNIYIIPDMPHQYPKNKVISLPKPKIKGINAKNKSKKVLILGQYLASTGLITKEAEIETKNRIVKLINENKYKDIYYIPHTMTKSHNYFNELLIDGAKIIPPEKPIELYMMDDNHFDVVIATLSSALITTKIFFGKDIRVISIGTELLPEKTHDIFKESISFYKQLGIEVL